MHIGNTETAYLALPLVKREGLGLAKGLDRVLRLRGSGGLLLGGRGSLGLLLLRGLGSLGLLLLLGRGVDGGLLAEDGLLADDAEDVRLVGDGQVVAGAVRVGLAPLGVEDGGERRAGDAGDKDVGERDALADEEGAVGEGLLEEVERLEGLGLGGLDGRLQVRAAVVNKGQEPLEDGREVGVGDWAREGNQTG